ncbi:MAG: hypothetical protein ACK5CA_14720 [Cyanobacteriota bacterium]|jgi:hypothetical protein
MMNFFIFGIVFIYLVGIWRFWSGYHNTHFSRKLPTRLALSFGWPGLLIVNASYRRNFRRALRGR